MIFHYKALAENGEVIKGKQDADSKLDVIEMLKVKKMIPLEVNEDTSGKAIKFGSKKVRTKDLSIFCRQFSTMLASGVGIVKCLDILEKQANNPRMKDACADMMANVQRGNLLSDTMKFHKNIFPSLMIQMVVAGEASGNLDVVMDRLAITYEKEAKIENKMKSAMIYPIILLVVMLGVITFILVFVMPKFAQMFQQAGKELPLSTRIMMGLSSFIVNRWYIIIAIVLAFVILILQMSRSKQGRQSLDRFKLKAPLVGKQFKMIITSRFTRTMSTLLSSGVTLLEAMTIVGKVVGNTDVESRLDEASEEIKKGIAMSRAVSAVGVFPPMVVSMLKIGEESGSLDLVLSKTADYYDEELDTAIQRLVGMLEPLLIVVMGIVVGFVVVSIAQPMFGLYNTI